MLRMETRAQRGKTGRISKYVVACVILCTTLSSCVEQPTRTHLEPRDNDGGVLLKISENLQISPVTVQWGDSVMVRRMPDAVDPNATCYALHRSLRGEAASTYLGGALPPGTYEFPTIGLRDLPMGDCNQGDQKKANQSQFGKFIVSAGKLTYLGVMERTGSDEGAEVRGGGVVRHRYMIPMPLDEAGNLDELVREDFPGLQKLDTHGPQGWVAFSLPPRGAGARYALDNSYGLFDPAQAPDGTWFFGSRTGVVRTWRDGQTRAQLHDTHHRVALIATAVLPDASWLVAGEESTLLRSTDEGKTWQSVRGDLPFGLIEHVVSVGQGVLLTLVDDKKVFLFRSDLRSMHWTKVASYETEFSHWTGIEGVQPQSFLVGDAYVTSLPSKHLAVYHPSTGTSEVLNFPGAVSEFIAGDDGVLRCRCTATIAVNPYESHDLGKIWTSMNGSRYMLLPAMADATHGVTWYKSGLFDKPTLAYTEDGQTWQRSINLTGFIWHFYFSHDHKTAYALNEFGVIWASRDGGKHWDEVLNLSLPAGDMFYY